MDADITHPPPGNCGRLSFTSLVGSIEANVVQHASRMEVQSTPRDVVEDLENMCVHLFERYREAMGVLPKHLLFYRDTVPEGEFEEALQEEIPSIRKHARGFTSTPISRSFSSAKRTKFVSFPDASVAEGGPSGQEHVVDIVLTSPVEWDLHLCSHQGILGTSKTVHYNVLFGENAFTSDVIQSFSYALRHVYARCARSVSIPAPPVCYAHNVCTRTKNHYDPQADQEISTAASDVMSSAPSQAAGGPGDESSRVTGFQKTHEPMMSKMYFC